MNNIGAGDQMTKDEIETLLREVGGSVHHDGDGECVISEEQMLDLLSGPK